MDHDLCEEKLCFCFPWDELKESNLEQERLTVNEVCTNRLEINLS